MELRYELDYALREGEYGYELTDKEGNKKNYDRYMNNKAWKEFLKKMEKEDEIHYKQYNDGSGNELKEGRYPPKMACFGSSSRFIYNLLKREDVIFEKKLDTEVGGTANLDAYKCKEDTEIFIEAKSREIYGSNNNAVKNVYKEVYDHIKKEFTCFNYNDNGVAGKKEDEKFKCKFTYNGEKVYLDIKQLICHFLAISANYLQNDAAKDNIRFIYLIYNPKELGKSILSERYEKVIKEIEGIKEKATELFEVIFNYQKKENKKLKIQHDNSMPKFEFVLADQYTIKEHI